MKSCGLSLVKDFFRGCLDVLLLCKTVDFQYEGSLCENAGVLLGKSRRSFWKKQA